MGLGSLLTGLAIYKPVQFGWLTMLLGGYEAARALHIAQVVRAGWNNFRAMVAGFELVEVNSAPHELLATPPPAPAPTSSHA